MGKTEELPRLPEGYRLDLASDPHAPALLRPNGVVVARFGAWGMTYEAVEREAWGTFSTEASNRIEAGSP